MIKIGIGLGSRYFTARGGASPASVYAFPSYTDFSTTYQTETIFYSDTPELALGMVLYYDLELIEPAQEINVILKEASLDNGVAITTDSNGLVNGFTRCYQWYLFYEFCGNSGPAQQFYTRYNDTLTDGIFLYYNPELTEVFANGIRALDGVIYSTSTAGEVSITYCVEAITGYGSCYDFMTGINSSLYYVRDADYASVLVDGTRVYSDSDGLYDIQVLAFVYNNYNYIYDSTTGTTMNGLCGT